MAPKRISRPKLSVVITVFNEAENIQPLIKRLFGALKQFSYEIVYVDDGSTDATVSNIMAANSRKIKLIQLKKNCGQSAALAAGIEHAQGQFICTMDGDLQNDPSDIPLMLEKAEKEEWDLVAGIRSKRKDGFVLRKIPSKIANMIIRGTTNVRIKDYGCTLKVFKSDIAKNLGLYGELHRFIPVLASLQGAKISQMNVKHHARQFGKSKYGISRTLRVISDLILMVFFQQYLTRPMHIFGTMGIVAFGVGVLINVYLLMVKLMGHDIGGRPLLILGAMLVLGGIQLITIGIVAELVIRTYYESQEKKPYLIKDVSIGKK